MPNHQNPTIRPTRTRTRTAVPVLGIVASLLLTGCGSDGGSGDDSGGDYLIGVQIDQTGISRSVGVPQLEGIKAAIDGVNRRGGVNGKKIKLVVRDDGSDAARAVSTYRELSDQQNVSAIAGFIGSVSIPPVAGLAASQKLALLVTGAPASLLEPVSPAVFSTIANLNAQGKAGLDYIKRLATDSKLPADPRIALLYYASPAGENWVKAVRAYAKSLDLNIVVEQNSTVGAATLSSQMEAITAAKPDAILAFDIESDIINAAKAGKASGLDTNTTIVDYSFASSPSALKGVSDQGFPNYVASANYGVPGGDQDTPGVKQFGEDAKANGLDPNKVMLPEGYAQGLIIADVLKRCGKVCPREKFLTTLEDTNTDLNGFAFNPVTYGPDNHQGVSAVRFRQWDPSSKAFTYSGDPIPLNFK